MEVESSCMCGGFIRRTTLQNGGTWPGSTGRTPAQGRRHVSSQVRKKEALNLYSIASLCDTHCTVLAFFQYCMAGPQLVAKQEVERGMQYGSAWSSSSLFFFFFLISSFSTIGHRKWRRGMQQASALFVACLSSFGPTSGNVPR